MTSVFYRIAFVVSSFFMCANLSAQEDMPPQYILDFKGLLEKVNAAWARGDNQFIKKESAAYLDKNRHDAGALSLGMFVAFYCERDWKKADALQKEIFELCGTSKQREAVAEILHDTCDMVEWKKVAEDDGLYANAIAALKRVFKDKFPGSECALLVEITFYRSSLAKP
jgi:hypothetical protein